MFRGRSPLGGTCPRKRVDFGGFSLAPDLLFSNSHIHILKMTQIAMPSFWTRRYPKRDHLNRPWKFSSWRRKWGGGRPLKVRLACLREFGDWAWRKQSMNLCGWKDGPEQRCCWKCPAGRLGPINGPVGKITPVKNGGEI